MVRERIVGAEEIEDFYQFLALTREEIPVISLDPWSSFHPVFFAPIHRLVLELPAEVRFNQRYAEKVFGQAWDWTVEDVERFISDPDNKIGDGESRYLEGMVGKGRGYWHFKRFGRPQDSLLLSAECHGLGTTVFTCHYHHLPPVWVPSQVGFSEKKARAYSVAGEVSKGKHELSFRAPLFMTYNVDNIVQAFLLRNWCIAYHNRLLRIALGLGTSE